MGPVRSATAKSTSNSASFPPTISGVSREHGVPSSETSIMMARMTISEAARMFMRQLSYLIALDKHQHFGRAAESCHVSQPALSNAIRDLEQELGITIIKRNRTFQVITPEGKRVILWARQMLASLEGLRQEAELVRTLPSGHLAIGVVPAAIDAATLLSAEYRQNMPQLSLEVLSLSTPVIVRRSKGQELHLGPLYSRSVTDEVYDVLPLFSERHVLVAGEQVDRAPMRGVGAVH